MNFLSKVYLPEDSYRLAESSHNIDQSKSIDNILDLSHNSMKRDTIRKESLKNTRMSSSQHGITYNPNIKVNEPLQKALQKIQLFLTSHDFTSATLFNILDEKSNN